MWVRHSHWMACSLLLLLVCSLSSLARAQSDSAPAPKSPDTKAEQPHRNRDRDEARRRNRYPHRFDLRPQFYRSGRGYRYGVPAIDAAGDEIEQAYQQGLADGGDSERVRMRIGLGLASYKLAMRDGHVAFLAGKYGLAARQFLLAATLNQGDAASRVRAADTQIALKAYTPAARLLHRAFELQPKLVFLPMDIRGAYGVEADFPKHHNALKKAAEQDKEDVDLWFLLGYMDYYTDNMAGAARALRKAAELDPDDALIAELLSVADMSAPEARPQKDQE